MSRCCQLPGTGSALTWEKWIQTRSLTLQKPSASHYHAASNAGSQGPAATQDGPSHTVPSNNFSSVPSLARQSPQLGARWGFQSSEKSLCVSPAHVGFLHPHSPLHNARQLQRVALPHTRLWGLRVIAARGQICQL